MTTLDEFEALWIVKKSAYDDANAAYEEVQRDCDNEMRKKWEFETGHPWNEDQASSQPWYDNFIQPWNEKKDAIRAEWEIKEESFEPDFERMGREIVLEETDEVILAQTTCGSSWSFKDNGANKWAESSALALAHRLSFNGIEAEVRVVDPEESHSLCGSETWLTFGVFAKIDPRAVPLLPYLPPCQYLPTPELQDKVRAMLKGDVDPRVFMPFLPHDYKESVGIDFLGNDVDENRQSGAPQR